MKQLYPLTHLLILYCSEMQVQAIYFTEAVSHIVPISPDKNIEKSLTVYKTDCMRPLFPGFRNLSFLERNIPNE